MKLNATLLLCFAFLFAYNTNTFGKTTTINNTAPVIACNGFTYCESFSNSVFDEWIESFTFVDIDNTSGSNGGYADFTNFSTDVTLGESYMIAGTPGFTDFEYPEYFRVWIDYNSDGDFDDPNELVFDSGETMTTVNGTVSIPPDATLGITTLRVSMKFNGVSTSCETGDTGFGFGEVEDYCVNILPGDGCYTPIINITDITDVSALATWTDIADAESYNIRYREVGSTTWTETNQVNNSLTLDLLGCVIYETQVQSLCAGGLMSGYSSSSEFLTFGCGNCLDLIYCIIENPNANSFIENVTLNTMNSSSGNDGGYADNTGPVTTSIDKGITYSISTTAGDGDFPSNKWYAAYIDFNADGDFEDEFEKVMDSEEQIADVMFTSDFLVPANAVLGTTRLRVFVQNFDNDGPDPCQEFLNGEVEDYCIEIAPGNGCYQTAVTVGDITDMGALVSWLAVDASESYTVRYRETGTSVWTEENTTNNSITLNLMGCISSEVQVQTNCGGGLNSGYTSSATFTTLGCEGCIDLNYCESEATNADDDFIESVVFGSINNISGNDNGYADFGDDFSATFLPSQAYEMVLTPGWTNFMFNVTWSVWIDYNQDGDFEDANELAFTAESSTDVQTANIIIPLNATIGSTKMRISQKEFSLATPCETFTFGEVEDYCIEIIPGNGCYQTALTVSDITETDALISWLTVDSSESYNLRYRELGTMTWTELNTTNNSTTIDLTGCTFYEAQIETLCGGGLSSGYTLSSEFITFGCGNCLDLTYCPIENANDNSFIENVTLNTMNSNSDNDGGYADNTGPITTSIDKGVTYSISTTAGDGNFPSDKWYAAYIDFNADGDFDDDFEKIMDNGEQTADVMFASTFLVPANAIVGTTRLRVFVQNFDNDGPDPCQEFLNGEAEDYCIEIAPGNGCYQTAVTVSDITDMGALISWLAVDASESYTFRYREIGTSTWTEENTTNNSITLDLLECISYEIQVQTNCGGGLNSGYTLSTTFLTLGCGACIDLSYCESEATNANDDFIDSVTFGSMENESGNDGGYANFGDDFGAMYLPGETYNMVLTPGWTGFMFNVTWSVWIDYNQDGDFDDANELVFTAESSTDIQTTDITIPLDATIGLTKMRISQKEFSMATPCETFTFGEVEDYCLTIQPAVLPCLMPQNLDTTDVTSSSVNMIWEVDQFETAIGYIIRFKELAATDWMEFSAEFPTYETSGLTICTDYEYQVRSVCPQDVSEYTESFVYQTSCFVGTEDLNQANINALKVYPNPFTDKIILDFELKKPNTVSIRLLNLNGQLIQERVLPTLGEGSHQFELLQSDLAAGLYMIQLATAEEVVIRKVVKR